MKLTTTTQIVPRFHKRSSKASSYKRLLVNQQKSLNGSKREILRETSPCDNSDDSGLGTDNNADYLYNSAIPHPSVFRFASSQKRAIENSYSLNSKRHRIDGIKEQNDLGDPYSFPLSHVTLGNSNSICASNGMQSSIPSPSKSIRRSLVPAKRLSDPVTLTSQLSSTSRNGKVSLQIVNQPEQQHRARYQTEGSRGAVKDRTGNSFPIVKVVGYNRLTTLQVFIGSDQGRVAPHMFYQACRVTGKNSTPCVEKNVDGTVVIEIDVEPTKDMTVTCDCVGILKERNVDVEHRFPDECSTRSKKKSTRCRMVFRTVITNEDGSTETLQVASQPIACTQPPGVPEICKKSLTNCTANGGKELFILGKNFLKDTHVRFYTDDWEQTVTPDKEFLQQTHLVCVVPAYKNVDITEAVSAKITVISGNRAGEPHTFTYTPMAPVVSPVAPITLPSNPVPRVTSPPTAKNDSGLLKPDISIDPDPNAGLNGKVNDTLIKTPKSPTDDCENVHPAMLWPASNLSSPTTGNCSLNQNDSKMMPPPAMPLRRPSAQMIASDGLPSSNIKADVSNASSSVIPHFPNVAGNSLPNSLNQRAYLSPQYSAMSECAPMIAEYPSSYRTISEMKSDAVPKLEPLPDPPSLCSNSYQATSPDLDARSTQMCLVPSMKNSVTQCSDLYSNSHNYEYPSSNLYSGTMVKNESEARLSVEDLSAFATSRSAGNGLPFNSMSMLDSSNMGGMKLPCSQNALNGNDSSSYVVSPTFQMNSVMTHGNVLSSAATRSSYPKNDKILTLDLSDSASADGACSSYNHNAKKKSFQFDKLFEAKSQQALVSCSMKNSANYENARDAVCFKNTQSASEPNMPMYQNYLNLENARTLNSSESVRQSYNKLDENKMVASLDVVKSSMMLNEVSSLMEGPTQMARKASSDAYALPISKTYQTARSLNGADGSSLMNSQSEESVMNEFVSAPMVDNAINTVPKLEELVNCAAENHIRSANKSATSAINLLNNSAMSNMYLTNETSRANGNCNDMPNAISPSRTSVSENPLLACTDDLSSYQRATNAPRNDIEATNATNKSSDSMELKNMNVKQDKTVNVPGMTKKTEEGVFSSDISRMTETDLLSYINPSCFDEVQR